MIHFGLVCLLHSQPGFKTVTLKKGATVDELRTLYHFNLIRTFEIMQFAETQGIYGYRVSSALFPLLDHPEYAPLAQSILEEPQSQALFKRIKQFSLEKEMYLSLHPDQFCLLSSLRDDVNVKSLEYLELHSKIAEWMNIQAINIHGGSKSNGFDTHYRIFRDALNQASQQVRRLLTLENDEKSYSVEELLNWCEKEKLSFTYDAHHERCFQKKKNNLTLDEIDSAVIPMYDRIIATWQDKPFIMSHLSSPRGSWNSESFREWCSHHDYIDTADIPTAWWSYLSGLSKPTVIDIEAKHKETAIAALKHAIISV